MPDASEEERRTALRSVNRDLLEFTKEELAHTYPGGILVIADLGLWNGRRPAFREIPSGRLEECFVPGRDTEDIRWYLDRKGDLRCEDVHHDGTNRYLYRAWKEGAGGARKDRLRERICEGMASRADVERLTESVGEDIGRVYGWTFPERQREYAR